MPHLVQAASVLLLAAVAEASCLSWCIAPLLPGKAGQSLFALPEDHLSTRIKSASATRVGEIGEYLQCRRLRNESSGEAAAHYALVQFELALMPHPTSQFYGCCVPASCASIDVESGLLVELPDLLGLATASLRQTDRALGALDEALVRLNNVSSFLGVEAQLRVEASRANASAMPALAGALAAAAEAAEGAAQLDRGLREAGKLAARINNSKLERALAAADEALRAGPAGGWRASLFSLRAELGEKVRARDPPVAACRAHTSTGRVLTPHPSPTSTDEPAPRVGSRAGEAAGGRRRDDLHRVGRRPALAALFRGGRGHRHRRRPPRPRRPRHRRARPVRRQLDARGKCRAAVLGRGGGLERCCHLARRDLSGLEQPV